MYYIAISICSWKKTNTHAKLMNSQSKYSLQTTIYTIIHKAYVRQFRRLECCFYSDTKTCSSCIEILDFNGACFVAIIDVF